MTEARQPAPLVLTSAMVPFTCGLDAALKIIASKWRPLIIYFLLFGPSRCRRTRLPSLSRYPPG